MKTAGYACGFLLFILQSIDVNMIELRLDAVYNDAAIKNNCN